MYLYCNKLLRIFLYSDSFIMIVIIKFGVVWILHDKLRNLIKFMEMMQRLF